MSDFPIVHPWNQELWQHLTLEPERANHALLFNGDKGLGKKDLAFSLAHFVMTDAHSQSADLFAAGSHPDLHVLMPEDHIQEDLLGAYAKRYLEAHSGKPKRTITIDQVRKLSSTLTTHPHISSHRVIMILAAQTMNRNAANALLKSLEEPPANTLFLIVTDDISSLAKTVRSRCSLINFNAPDFESGEAWLKLQNQIPETEIASHLAMANNHPIQALTLYEEGYLESLKSVFTDVNSLWTRRTEATQAAKSWQAIGGLKSIDILQKLTTDLLRCCLSKDPQTVYFPVQKSWVQSVAMKLSSQRLQDVIDELIYAKKMLATSVDELLVLETVSIKIQSLPA